VVPERWIEWQKDSILSLDDGYSPPKTVEHTRRLVENEDVLLLFSLLGTAHNPAAQKYLNAKHVVASPVVLNRPRTASTYLAPRHRSILQLRRFRRLPAEIDDAKQQFYWFRHGSAGLVTRSAALRNSKWCPKIHLIETSPFADLPRVQLTFLQRILSKKTGHRSPAINPSNDL
jgi:hypothetical protein